MDALPAALDITPPPSPRHGTIDVELRGLACSYAHLRVLDARAQARLCTSLAMQGQRHPVLVVRRKAGRYMLIDGYLRVDGRCWRTRPRPCRGVVRAHGAMKSLLPLARANKAHCERLCEQLGDTRLSMRWLGHLYAAYRAGGAEQRERIANAPLLFLEAKRAITRAEPDGAGGVLVRALDSASLALVRTADSAKRAWNLEPPSLFRAPVERAVSRWAHAYEALVRHVEEPRAV